MLECTNGVADVFKATKSEGLEISFNHADHMTVISRYDICNLIRAVMDEKC